MHKVILDTDTLSEIYKEQNPTVAAKAQAYLEHHDKLAYTSVTASEFLFGFYAKDAKRQLNQAKTFLKAHEELVPTSEDYWLVAEINGALKRIGRPRKFYLGGKWGFMDGRVNESKSHCVSSMQFVAVIDRFLAGDTFDMLWVARIDDEYSGLILNLENGSPVGTLSFKTISEAEQISGFVNYLSEKGYSVEAVSRGFCGGFTESHRETSLDFPVHNSTTCVVQAIECVLDRLQPTGEAFYYVSGSRTSDQGFGIKFGKLTDPLVEILGP